MALVAYRLAPRNGGGFHFGREGLDLEVSAETYPSDSLFSALVVTIAELEGEQAVDDFLSEWPLERSVEPPFRLSSLFPYAGELPLLPMPRVSITFGELEPARTKTLKRLKYVSPLILNRLLAGHEMGKWLPVDDRPSEGLLLQNGQIWLGRSEQKLLPAEWQAFTPDQLVEQAVWKVTTVPRVAIDRASSSSTIYQVGRTTYAPDCGLWLLAEVDRGGDLLDELLQHLADQGIGGERTSGYGAFDVHPMTPPTLPSPQLASRFMTLSRYNPLPEEVAAGVLGEEASYELVDVGGWITSSRGPAQRRKRVRLIEAGSILVAAMPITGRLVDVRPEYPGHARIPAHPVYRSGIALTIGIGGE